MIGSPVSWLRRHAASLRARILVVFSVLTIFPVVVVGLVSSSVALVTVREGSFDSTAEVARQLAVNVGLRMGDAEKMLKIADLDAVVRFVNPWRQSEERTYKAALEILSAFSLLRGTYDFADIVKGVYILGFNGNAMNELSGRYAPRIDLRTSRAVLEALKRPGEAAFVSSDEADFAAEGPAAADVVSISRAIVRIATHDVLGAVVVNLDRAAIRGLCGAARLGETGRFALLTGDGSFVYPKEGSSEGAALAGEHFERILAGERGRFVASPGGEPELFVFDTIPGSDWKILGRVRLAELGMAARKIQWLTFLAVAASAILMILLYLFITNVLTRPIRSLEAVIARVEGGELGARANPSGSDEVAKLARSFDLLMDRIGLLIKEVVRDQEELKKMELRTLQAQINPHFLYNTLDAIVWMAEAGKKEEIVQMAKSLSSFFRLSLSRGEDWISLDEEVKHVLSYLSIQKTRYRDILDYSIRVDDRAREMPMLKLTLQPLVENAVYHGVKNKRGGGCISIDIDRREGDSLLIRIADDGAGMGPERLEAVRQAMANREGGGDARPGYGLRNVRRRLELYYGDGASLGIEAREGGGTVVTLSLPAPSGATR